MTGWLPPLVAVALALAAGGSARADVCVVVNPVLDIGCRDGQDAPAGGEPTLSSEPAGAPREPEPTARSSTVVRYDPGRVAPERRAEVLAALQSSSAVASASKEPISEALDTSPDDTDWPQQDGLRVAGFPKAWDVTQGSSKIVVAVIDTGVDSNHPDLRGALVPGWNFVGNNADSSDDHGHGTAVAGVVAARSNNHVGGAGICWRCLIMPVKVLDAKGAATTR